MQRSRFVCRILNFCVKKPCSRGHFVLARKGRRIYGGEPNEQAVKQIVNVGKDCEAIVLQGKESIVAKKYTCGNWNPQKGLCSFEENGEFRGACAAGTNPFRPTVTRRKLEDAKHLRFLRTGSARLSVQFRLREVTRWTKTEFVHSSLATQPE